MICALAKTLQFHSEDRRAFFLFSSSFFSRLFILLVHPLAVYSEEEANVISLPSCSGFATAVKACVTIRSLLILLLILKEFFIAPIYHTRRERRAHYNNTNHTQTHTHVGRGDSMSVKRCILRAALKEEEESERPSV